MFTHYWKVKSGEADHIPLLQELTPDTLHTNCGGNNVDEQYEPTPEEKKNGWTRSTLKAYILGREKEQAHSIFKKKVIRPREQNHKYQPHKWRS